MDAHCDDISIALYVQERADGRVGVVHTFSRSAAAAARVEDVASAMAVLAGLDLAEHEPTVLRFGCDDWHEAAIRRAFLEACKLPSARAASEKPLAVHDKQSGQEITVQWRGDGVYHVAALGAGAGESSRARAAARGIAKLAELDIAEGNTNVVVFGCGKQHDALVGLLLPRALNVRAVLREEESRSSRGVLAAPSANQE